MSHDYSAIGKSPSRNDELEIGILKRVCSDGPEARTLLCRRIVPAAIQLPGLQGPHESSRSRQPLAYLYI